MLQKLVKSHWLRVVERNTGKINRERRKMAARPQIVE